ncbi:hypothetical protein [Pseudorhodobacter sp.]|uniref:hypothetical protein n=1 Tax=Pseudorhodobacter sp. TaxID=1934400 RepID=UPI002649C641|nr:hypothetical protein [Pseudorhodobacter sp.]MDN5785732.1 hypothetical protein [Pseudorhodobacter sp.]
MRLSNNITLPTLPLFAARSTWAMVIAALITIFNTLGIDLLGFFTSIGAGSTPDEVLATGQRVVSAWQIVAPLALGFWAWVERRAPNFRLTLGSAKTVSDVSGIGAAVVALALFGAVPTGLRAETLSRCFDPIQLKQSLTERYGEELVGAGMTGSDVATLIYSNVTTGSWTLVAITADRACVLMAGEHWSMAPGAPPGDPA